MESLAELQAKYDHYKSMDLALSMTRGQPSDDDFTLSNGLLSVLTEDDLVTPSGVALRNYPGGVYGLPEARALFCQMLGVEPDEILVGNNSSLEIMSHVLMWGMISGLKESDGGWAGSNPKLLITVPGYDRHFKLAAKIGYELVPVPMTESGPDMDVVEALVAEDASIKGIFFVPVYSNPTGDTVSDETVDRLVSMPTAAADFTILADNAYAVHHLTEEKIVPKNLLRAAEAAGNPDRVYLFGSTSKITFAGGGVSLLATSKANLTYIGGLFGLQTIGPNKVEQYRHVKFLEAYPGGLEGLMADHRKILGPKFQILQDVLARELGDSGIASWTDPKGGYFVSLDTAAPVASRVIELAKGVGVALTPAGATYPGGVDPNNTNIRLAPSRPPLAEVELAMEVVATCIKLATVEYDQAEG